MTPNDTAPMMEPTSDDAESTYSQYPPGIPERLSRRPTFEVPLTIQNDEPRALPTASRSSQRSNGSLSLLRQLTIPERPVGNSPSLTKGIKAIVTVSRLNVLLVFVPIAWACSLALDDTDRKKNLLTFAFAFLALVPLTQLLAFATDELSLRVGHILANLLNITLSNLIEMIIAIIALSQCQIQVVQASLIGSILSNLLLVLGICFFAGGMRFSEQGFQVTVTKLNSSLLVLFVITVLLPVSFNFAADMPAEVPDLKAQSILSLSRGAAIILIVLYACSLIFQLFSHKNLYDGNGPTSTSYALPISKRAKSGHSQVIVMKGVVIANGHSTGVSPSSMPTTPTTPRHHVSADVEAAETADHDDDEEEVEQPQMSVPLTVSLLVVVTAIVAVTAKFLVDSIDGLTSAGHLSKEFIGLILPLAVGNMSEHAKAITVSVKDKITLSLHIAVGSSIQMALFVIPLIVILGWIMGKPMSLFFDPFQSIVVFLSVLIVNYAVQGGTSNWMEGMVLICLYTILAVVFWYYPGVSGLPAGLTC